MIEDWEERKEKIVMAKQSQALKDMNGNCHCGLKKTWHTAIQANRCKKRNDVSQSVEPKIRATQNKARGLDVF